MAKCTKCGSENWLVIDRLGSLETWRCGTCGQEELFHASRLDFSRPSDFEPALHVVGRCISKPTKNDVTAAQALFPELASLPISKILRAAISHSDMELGRFTAAELASMAPQLSQLGIETISTPIIVQWPNTA